MRGLRGAMRKRPMPVRSPEPPCPPHPAPKIQLSARQLCAFADSGQAPMSGPCAFVEYLWVNSDPVIGGTNGFYGGCG